MNLIDKEALQKEFAEKCCGECEMCFHSDENGMCKIINEAHAVSGHWIQVDDSKCRCSNCDVIALIALYPMSANKNYCPNCGVRMR